MSKRFSPMLISLAAVTNFFHWNWILKTFCFDRLHVINPPTVNVKTVFPNVDFPCCLRQNPSIFLALEQTAWHPITLWQSLFKITNFLTHYWEEEIKNWVLNNKTDRILRTSGSCSILLSQYAWLTVIKWQNTSAG